MRINQQARKLELWAPLFELQKAVWQHVRISSDWAGHVDHVSLVASVEKEQSVGGLAIESSSSLKKN